MHGLIKVLLMHSGKRKYKTDRFIPYNPQIKLEEYPALVPELEAMEWKYQKVVSEWLVSVLLELAVQMHIWW